MVSFKISFSSLQHPKNVTDAYTTTTSSITTLNSEEDYAMLDASADDLIYDYRTDDNDAHNIFDGHIYPESLTLTGPQNLLSGSDAD